MWIILIFINLFVILLSHYLIFSNFKISLLFSNIFWLTITYIFIFLHDWKIINKYLIVNIFILVLLNFVISYIFWFKMQWGKVKKYKETSKKQKQNEFEMYWNIIDIKWFDVRNIKK